MMNVIETKKEELKVTSVESENAVELTIVPDIQHDLSSHQQQMVRWVENKLAGLMGELAELEPALAIATKNRWGTRKVLTTQVERTKERILYYEKMKSAFAAGYVMIPNMPIDLFAVRTNREKPLKKLSVARWKDRSADAQLLPAGEGEYKNPDPLVGHGQLQPDAHGKLVESFQAVAFQDEIDFPMVMAKPSIMEATSQAMALKIFDQVGILPVTKQADPIILGQIIDPRKGWYSDQRVVSFLIAWRISTADL